MGRSFYTGTDEELFTGAKNFNRLVQADSAALSIPAPLAAALDAATQTYVATYIAVNAPAARRPGLTSAKNDARASLRSVISTCASLIDGTPSVSDQTRLDLGLSVRAKPSPRPAPGPCSFFVATLNTDGTLSFKWKCQNPDRVAGTMYRIFRCVGHGNDFVYLGDSGKRKYTDTTLPAGTSIVTYQIQAVRSTKAGPATQFNVNFGVRAGGAVAGFTPAKLAA